MKKIIAPFLLTFVFTLFALAGYCQPNPPGGNHGSSGNQNGGNAPIGSGLFILLGLGAAYAGKKLYNMKKDSLEE